MSKLDTPSATEQLSRVDRALNKAFSGPGEELAQRQATELYNLCVLMEAELSARSETRTPEAPLCCGHADSWFCGRNHLVSGHDNCVVCAFEATWLRSATRAPDENAQDAARYRWLRDYGHSRVVVGTASMTPGRGPYIRLDPPAHNQFSGMTLWAGTADALIDEAMK